MQEKKSFQLLSDVDISYFSLDDSSSERERLYEYLNDTEKLRAARYRFDIHRFRFISGRGKLREILANTADCQPEEIIFAIGEFGKPYIKSPASSNVIQFNASKSSVMGAVAISQGSQVGLDIERIKYDNNFDYDLIVENEFTCDEIKWYQKHDTENRHVAFYTLWTCKEAYLKVLGCGLNDSLDKFTVSFEKEQPFISYTELESENNSAYTLYQKKFSQDYLVCLATKDNDCRIRFVAR